MKKILLFFILAASIILPSPGQAQEPAHQAGVVIQYPDGQYETACIEFSEDEITGVNLLERSGLTINFGSAGGLGTSVCKIGQIGCNTPDEHCFCQCKGSPCTYWNYWHIQDGAWKYSPLGAGSHLLSDGDIDGWVWGDGQEPPQEISLNEICHTAAETPEAAAVAFASPLNTPTAHPTMLFTPTPVPLARPTMPAATFEPPARPTATLENKVLISSTIGGDTNSNKPDENRHFSPDRYAGFAGALAALGFIALVVWRRKQGS